MSYYIETPVMTGKMDYLVKNHRGREIPSPHYVDPASGEILIVVVENDDFEAAGIAMNEYEFKRFTALDRVRAPDREVIDGIIHFNVQSQAQREGKQRRRWYVIIPTEEAVKLNPRIATDLADGRTEEM